MTTIEVLLFLLFLLLVRRVLKNASDVYRHRHSTVADTVVRFYRLDDRKADYDPLYHMKNDDTRDVPWVPPPAVDPWAATEFQPPPVPDDVDGYAIGSRHP